MWKSGPFRAVSAALVPTFTPAWSPMLLGDGGNARAVHALPSGDVLACTDTYGGYLYLPGGGAQLGAATLAAPSWQELVSTNSIDPSLWSSIFGTQPGVSDITESASNPNVFYMIFEGAVFVSSNRGGKWLKTGMTTDLVGANGGATQSNWIAVDPNNPDIVYVQTTSSGLFSTTSGRAGTGWAHVAGLTSATGNGGSIFYDPSSPVSGGVTQHFYVSVDGVGVYETTNGGVNFTLLNSAGFPTRIGVIAVDKFGQLWVSPGFYAGGNTLYKYASGSWSTISTLGTGVTQALAIMFDPNTGGSVLNNHVIVVDLNGLVGCSLDNGTSWTAVNSVSFASAAPQALWLGTAAQFQGGGAIALGVNGGSIDASGRMWIAAGISVWTAPNPIVANSVSSSLVWSSNSIGIEQLVANKMMAAPGQSPLTGTWDRGILYNPNPDAFATVQLTQDPLVNLNDCGGLDYAPNMSNVAVAQLSTESLVSLDGGNTWSQWASFPAGMGTAGVVAVNTDQKWCSVPGNSVGAAGKIYFTANGATSWTQSTVPGTPTFIQVNQKIHRQPLAADKVTSGVFYAVDTAQNFYKSTDGGANFSIVSTATAVDGNTGADKLQAVPGRAGHVFYAGHPSNGGHLWKSTDGMSTWTDVNSGMDQIPCYGFGAPKPGGSGYPSIYAYGVVGGVFAIRASFDAGATWATINVPAALQNWPLNSFDYPMGWLTGDMNVFGRIYIAFAGSGVAYIDAADACPWVNFSSVKPGAALSGALTLTAARSGLVPVNAAQFAVDGAVIATVNGNSPSYSTAWNASAIPAGAHTLTVTAFGRNGSGSFSIPITTS